MKKLRVFIAEDNAKLKDIYLEHLEQSENIEVVGHCGDGLSAVAMIEELAPDVVILDIVMPELDGFDVMNMVNLDKKPKYIVVSQLIGDAFVSKAMLFGASYYMAKPVKMQTLTSRILEFLGSSVKPTINFESNKQFSVDSYKLRQTRSLDEKIANIFISVGIPAHIKGYKFLREAIKMSIDNPNIINSITKKLYPSIAVKYETTSSKVERAIRHAIEVAWSRGKIENINNIFGIKIYAANEKPTNGEFIALVADKMLFENAV